MIAGTVTLAAWKTRVAPGFRRHEPQDPREWLPRHVRFPDGWERPRYDFDEAPHWRGVIERFVLDPTKRKAILPWAVRCGKTSGVVDLFAWKADQDPVPMAWLFPDNDSLDNVAEHTYPMLEAIDPIAEQLPAEHLRNRRVIRLRDCRIRLASAGKKSSVSGYPARWIAKFEAEKIPRRKSSEADPSHRFDSRTSGFVDDVKIFEEGSPGKASESRMAEALNSTDNQQLRFLAPCPHCGRYQPLTHDQLRWEHNEHGKSEPLIAKRTAWYECLNGCRIDSDQRRGMIQRAQWVADGESIDNSGRITGTPAVDSDTMVFGYLGKLYSLLHDDWGEVAAEAVRAAHAFNLGNADAMEKFYSETLAIPWEPRQKTVKPPDLVERMRADDHPERSVLPEWTSFLTFTADVGKVAEEYVYYWMAMAWGGNARGGIVDWGVSQPTAEFIAEWREAAFASGSGRVRLWGQPAALDSSAYTNDVCALCDQIRNCYPLKGDTNSKSIDLYWPGYRRAGKTDKQLARDRKAGRHDLLFVNSELTQQWRLALVEGRLTVDDPGFVSLPGDVCDAWSDFEEFLQELTEDVKIDGEWQGTNNEFGDTLRYGRALAQSFTGNGRRWGKLKPIASTVASGTRFFSRSGNSGSSTPFVEGFN